MEVPSYQHHLTFQNGWIEVHMYFMGEETRRDITRNQAANDFFYGNDNYPNREPSEDFQHHLSPRGLTWEKECIIDYFDQFVTPAYASNKIPLTSILWVESKASDLHDRGLSMRTTHLVERRAA